MSANMEDILANQDQIIQAMEQQLRNFKKDSAERKTPANIKKRLQTLDTYWREFQENHVRLCEFEDRGYTYFAENYYNKTMTLYNEARDIIQQYKPPTGFEKGDKSPSTPAIRISDNRNQENADERQQTDTLSVDPEKPNIKPSGSQSTALFRKIVSQGNASKLEEMLRKQKSNFKALSRAIKGVDIESLSEKWEFEDVLRTIQAKWSTIDSLHWEIDSEMYSEDEDYEQEYNKYEQLYIDIKKLVNNKMYSVSYRESFTPKIEIPTFSGNYHKWISFKDLFQEAVHNNKSIPSAQKMQLLKSKLKGEAERIIQHLNISSENYQICWDILNHRYNNDRLIFTSHMNILLSIPTMQNQVDTQIKNMFDTINECMNALKNLGIDVTAMGPTVVHLLTLKLDNQTLSEYTQSLENPRALPVLADFLKFLENKYTALESTRRKHHTSKSSSSSSPSNNKDSEHQFNKKNQSKSNNFNSKNDSYKPFLRSSAAKSCAIKTQYCPLCKDDSHGLFYCKPFLESESDEKRNTVQKFNLCKNCLVDHKNKPCRSESRCRVCQGTHNTVLHDALQENTVSSNMNTSPSTSRKNKTRSNVTHVSRETLIEVLLATALVRIQGANGEYHTMRALIDQGSQASLITENAAQILKLPRRACKGVVVGVSANQTNCKGVLSLVASSLQSNYTFQTEVIVMNKLINNLPNHSFSKPSWEYLHNIQLADPDFNVCRPIDLLLGAEVYSEIIMPGIIKENSSLPIAQQTQLGWILSGNVKSYQCNVVMNNIEDIQRFWNIEDVTEPDTNMSSEDYHCLQQYNSETARQDDGRYVVRIPLKPDIKEKLGESKPRAVAQFYQLERKFSRNKNISEDYKTFIDEYIKLGHMRECTRKNLPDCILPHLCVLRPDSTTTALRVVFNASAKTSTGYSLNDLMFSGPNLQQDLFTLILRWRQYEYAMTADIEKMFRQILCNEKDLQYQKIVWRESPNQLLREYELTTVTYGTKAAPFLAMMTLKRLAEDERSKYPTASAVLEQCFYMDDLLAGHHSLKEAKQLKADLIDLLKAGGFNLRKWSSNKIEIKDDAMSNKEQAFEFRHQESTKTLGLRWHPQDDQFKFQMKIDTSSLTPSTKRSLLSDISKIFDPLGWLSPVSTKLKLLFQKVWSLNLQWDDAVPTKINEEWLKIKKELPAIEHMNVPRWLQTPENANIELHGFCDSSVKAFACVIYCRVINHDKVERQSSVTIVAGKSKLVPVSKTISLPRLELCAAHLLAKLMKVVKNCLSSNRIQIYGWSDSTAVLGWLHGDPHRWKPFVANRVAKITETIPANSWRYVKSAENPADCASRGLSADQLQHHPLWWHGPIWLSTFKENKNQDLPTYVTYEEIRKPVKSNVIQQNEDIVLKLLNKYSNFDRAARVLAWTLRAISRNRHKQKYLIVSEIKIAKHLIIKQMQLSVFKEEMTSLRGQNQIDARSKLLKLNPFLDQEGLLRVGGRLNNAKMSQNMKHPLIIPNNTHLSDLLIDQGHHMTLHGGARVTQAWLRQQYWILGGNRAVKKRLRNCVKCRRHDPIKHEQLMGDLPFARSNPTRPFYHTGVDFTGFVDVKANKGRGIKTTKGYIAVFVCMATKAVHIELVSDLTSSSFLAALRRMAARRGTPGHVYSDNGTNFVGASRILNEEFISIQDTLDVNFFEAITSMEITWHFNAPSWPSAGGLWEAAVKSLKYHLKRVIGDQKLTFEEYATLLAQVEACLNSRPLCALSEDPEDLDCLTPSHFLASGPTLTIIETERDLRTRWQLTQKIFEDLWKRWRAEYLCQLSARSKWRKPHQNLKVNDIVIIHDINLPPGKWPIGRIIELHPGKDGYVRVVTLRTKSGTLKRPITKLSILPINDNTQSHDTEKENQESQIKNRTTSKPTSSKLSNFIITTLLLLMVICSGTCEHKISQVTENKNIFFDKLANMRLEREEWKLIVYCDMAPFWQGINLLGKFVTHLDNICSKDQISQCDVVRLQLRHGYNELEHYNNVLLGQQGQVRRRRGLINGIGYVAHSLFGVLDETFAEQYQKDITLIRQNQNHLGKLWRNQTSIVEAELNIIKRIENTLDKQHKIINQYITKCNSALSKLEDEIQHTDNKAEFTLSALIANNIMTNLKEIQETLVDTVANIFYEKINFHLLTPAQLKNELNIITGQISKDLTLPINNIQTDLAKIYHLLKVKARATREYLIFEVRIPLVSREDYELYNLIPIPQQAKNGMVNIVPVATHLAINIHKDSYIPVSISDLQRCIPYDTDEYICPLKKPVYQMTSDSNLCLKHQASNQCQTETKECRDYWTELNLLNSYLYFCCGQCSVRVICDDDITIEQLSKTGVITLGDSCVIKDRMFTIHAHKSLSNSIKMKIDVMNIEIPPINHIINLSIPLITPIDGTDDFSEQRKDIKTIEKALKDMKSDQELVDRVTSHDIHHYVAIYSLAGVVIACIILYVWRCVRAHQPRSERAEATTEQTEATTEQAEARVSYTAPSAISAAGRPTITTNRGSSPSVRTQFNDI